LKTHRWIVVSAAVGVAVLIAAVGFGVFGRGDAGPLMPPGSVATVDVVLVEVFERQSAFSTTSADGPKIDALAAVVRRASLVEEHRCPESGSLTFRKKDGWVVRLDLLAGHDGGYYEFRVGQGAEPGTYQVDRASLQRALSALGAGPLDPGPNRPK
jgi:hypothetical protein